MCTAVLLLWKSHVVEKMVRLMDYMSSVLYGSTFFGQFFKRRGEGEECGIDCKTSL